MVNSICPFNFEKFSKLNANIGNIEATLLLSKIKFHQEFSSYTHDNKTWAILTRKQIASWFGFSLDKTDKLLNLLIDKGHISKQAILWYGVKKLIITVDESVKCPAINFNLLDDLIEQAGSVKTALLFCHISFRFANSIIKHKNATWCCINKDTLANWSNSSIRTIDSMLKKLIEKGLINKSVFSWNNKSQSHFNIPNNVITKLQKHWNKTEKEAKNSNIYDPSNRVKPPAASPRLAKLKPANQDFCRSQPAKKPFSIIENTKTKKNSNNTCDITFSKNKLNVIGNKLTYRQIQYLRGAINNIKLRSNIKISNPTEFEEWVKFSILEESQRKGAKDFQHAVSRFMKIISDDKYSMPIGFSKHSEYGLKDSKRKREQKWEEMKREESQRFDGTGFGNMFEANNSTSKALGIAKRIADLSKMQTSANSQNGLNKMLVNLNHELKVLVGQGADVAVVREYLQNNRLVKNKTTHRENRAA